MQPIVNDSISMTVFGKDAIERTQLPEAGARVPHRRSTTQRLALRPRLIVGFFQSRSVFLPLQVRRAGSEQHPLRARARPPLRRHS